jgi:hypothetical protein
MSEQQVPEFEDCLRRLLERAAEAIPDDTDISNRVRHAVAQGRGTSDRGVGPRPLLSMVAAVLVVALLAGVLLFVRPGRPLPSPGGVIDSSTATATDTPPSVPLPPVTPLTCGLTGPDNPPSPAGKLVDQSTAVGRQTSVAGVTFTLDRAYADATQTVITFHTQASSFWAAMPGLPLLIDSQGNRYAQVAVGGSGYRTQNQGVIVFTPLPLEELSSPQLFTFTAQQMDVTNPNTMMPVYLNGPWQVSFNLTPVVGTSIALSNAPVTRKGVTVQPLRADVVPVGGGLDGMAGGVRLILRLSGLAHDMPLDEVADYETFLALRQGSSSGSCGGGILELVLPNGEQIAPGEVNTIGQFVPTSYLVATPVGQQPQTVGPSGTAELECMFFLPIPVVTRVILYVDYVTVAPAVNESPPVHVSGPWEFQLRSNV